MTEGYNAALRVDRRCADGWIGRAEAAWAASEAARAAGNDGTAEAADAARAYDAALSIVEGGAGYDPADPWRNADWSRLGRPRDRRDAAHNAACARVRAGDPAGAAARLAAVARAEVAAGLPLPPPSLVDAAADADLGQAFAAAAAAAAGLSA